MPRRREPSDDERLAAAVVAAERIRDDAEAVSIAWPSTRSPRYLVTVRLREIGYEYECVGVEVTALLAYTSVGTAVMRDLPVASLVRDAVRLRLAATMSTVTAPANLMTVRPDGTIGPPDPAFLDASNAALAGPRAELTRRLSQATGEGKGRRYPAGHLEAVAEIVREARRRKEPAQAAVMEAFGLKRSAAANQIARAKARGLLDREVS